MCVMERGGSFLPAVAHKAGLYVASMCAQGICWLVWIPYNQEE